MELHSWEAPGVYQPQELPKCLCDGDGGKQAWQRGMRGEERTNERCLNAELIQQGDFDVVLVEDRCVHDLGFVFGCWIMSS